MTYHPLVLWNQPMRASSSFIKTQDFDNLSKTLVKKTFSPLRHLPVLLRSSWQDPITKPLYSSHNTTLGNQMTSFYIVIWDLCDNYSVTIRNNCVQWCKTYLFDYWSVVIWQLYDNFVIGPCQELLNMRGRWKWTDNFFKQAFNIYYYDTVIWIIYFKV